jgi:nitrite reductase/ring-hydroxylating ferredoxin subunit/uncharacterized membrane protein
MYGLRRGRDNGLVHELATDRPKVIPDFSADVDGLWIHSCAGGGAMGRFIARLMAMQDIWARPLGDFNQRWLAAILRPVRPLKDLLSGVWLGHPLHAAITDIPIGTLLVTVVLDLAGRPAAADVALVTTVLFMLAAAGTGVADYVDTDGTARVRATLHSTLMVVGLALLVVSLIARAGDPADRTSAVVLSLIGFLIVVAGGYVGGDVVYLLGNMVSRHAFRGAGMKWIKLDVGDLDDLADLPEATPRKARAGINDLVLVRSGETVHALHAVCAHAGGPLPQGAVADGCIQCPWHGTRFRLSDGRVLRGPALYDQPSYEIRPAEGGGYEVRRTAH